MPRGSGAISGRVMLELMEDLNLLHTFHSGDRGKTTIVSLREGREFQCNNSTRSICSWRNKVHRVRRIAQEDYLKSFDFTANSFNLQDLSSIYPTTTCTTGLATSSRTTSTTPLIISSRAVSTAFLNVSCVALQTMTLISPVSSSSVINRAPLAVSGLCLVVTKPAT